MKSNPLTLSQSYVCPACLFGFSAAHVLQAVHDSCRWDEMDKGHVAIGRFWIFSASYTVTIHTTVLGCFLCEAFLAVNSQELHFNASVSLSDTFLCKQTIFVLLSCFNFTPAHILDKLQGSNTIIFTYGTFFLHFLSFTSLPVFVVIMQIHVRIQSLNLVFGCFLQSCMYRFSSEVSDVKGWCRCCCFFITVIKTDQSNGVRTQMSCSFAFCVTDQAALERTYSHELPAWYRSAVGSALTRDLPGPHTTK